LNHEVYRGRYRHRYRYRKESSPPRHQGPEGRKGELTTIHTKHTKGKREKEATSDNLAQKKPGRNIFSDRINKINRMWTMSMAVSGASSPSVFLRVLCGGNILFLPQRSQRGAKKIRGHLKSDSRMILSADYISRKKRYPPATIGDQSLINRLKIQTPSLWPIPPRSPGLAGEKLHLAQSIRRSQREKQDRVQDDTDSDYKALWGEFLESDMLHNVGAEE